jgi:hypothetical protein
MMVRGFGFDVTKNSPPGACGASTICRAAKPAASSATIAHRVNHTPYDAQVVPCLQQYEQIVEIQTDPRTRVKHGTRSITTVNRVGQLAQPDAIRMGADEIDDFLSVNSNAGSHGIRGVGFNGSEIVTFQRSGHTAMT